MNSSFASSLYSEISCAKEKSKIDFYKYSLSFSIFYFCSNEEILSFSFQILSLISSSIILNIFSSKLLLLSKITFYNCSLHLPTLSANFDVNYFWYLFIFSSHFFIIFVSISAHLRFKFYNKDYETLGSVLFISFAIVLNSSFTVLTISV